MTLIALLVIANFALGPLLIWDYYRVQPRDRIHQCHIEPLVSRLAVRTDPDGLKFGEWTRGLRSDNYFTWVRMWIAHQRAMRRRR